MFEKLITDFKKSLPEALRSKLGIVDNSNDESELEEDTNNVDDSSTDLSDEEKSKKTKSMVIKVIVILALGYIALDEFVLKDMNQNAEPTISAEVAPTTDNLPPAEVAEVAETSETVQGEASLAAEENLQVAANENEMEASTEVPPIENINVLEKVEEVAPVETVSQEASQEQEKKQEEEQPSLQTEEAVVSDTRVEETSADQKLDQLVENVEENTQTNPIEEIKVPSSGDFVEAPSMASKIVEEVIQTAPPAYDQIGRGLVYNCKDKFWACLDKPSYIACNKNQKWNQSKGNSVECVVADVYNSDDDCAKIQKYNVSTSASTAFCQN